MKPPAAIGLEVAQDEALWPAWPWDWQADMGFS